MSAPSHLPVLREAALAEFRAMPGGQPGSAADLATILVLAWMHHGGWAHEEEVLAARVRLVYLGLGDLEVPRDVALGLCHGIAARLCPSLGSALERVMGPSWPGTRDAAEARVERAWARIEARRAADRAQGEAIGQALAPLLRPGLVPAIHQLVAVARAEVRGWRLLVADDMGLGKSVTTQLCWLRHPAPFPALVIGPKSMTRAWERETRTWLAAKDPVVIVVDRPADCPARLPVGNVVVLASWGMLSTSPSTFTRHRWRFVVADECQAIVNPSTQRSRSFLALRRGAEGRLLLSGTPDPNGRAMEYWNLLRAVDETSVPGRSEFGRRYCAPSTLFIGTRRVTQYEGRSDHTALATLLAPRMIRRVKDEMPRGFLPSKTRYCVPVLLSLADRLTLDAERDRVRARLEARAMDLEHRLRGEGLSEAECRARVRGVLGAIAVSEAGALRVQTGLCKIPASREVLRDWIEAGHRPVVFAYYHRVAAAAVEAYRDLGAVRTSLGVDTSRARDALVQGWERGEGDILVITEKMHAGVTLVSGARLVFLERSWLPSKERQLEDRVHRIGQTRDTAVTYLHAPGTIDDGMAKVVTWKEVGSAAMQGSAGQRVLTWLDPVRYPVGEGGEPGNEDEDTGFEDSEAVG